MLLDTTPLRRDREYRLLLLGQFVGGSGGQVSRLVLPFQVYVLTGTPLAIAALTAVQLAAILVCSPLAGAVADTTDRRRVLVLSRMVGVGTAIGLMVLAAIPGTPLAAILGVAFFDAAADAVQAPASTSAVPRLVPAERFPAAIALNQLVGTSASIIGPALGGILLATVGAAGAYAVDAAAGLGAIAGFLRMRPMPPLGEATRPGLKAIREGLRYAAARRVILSTFVIDLEAMIFGMPTALFPVLALDVFKVGPAGLALLGPAPAVGAALAALFSGWVSSIRKVGLAVILAVIAWGLAITLFGLASRWFGLALVFIAIAGGADVISAVFRNSIVQLETPDELRGRVASIHLVAVTSGPRLGDIEAATVASLVGAQLSVVSGGILCLLGVAVVVWLFPELARHTARAPAGPSPASTAPPAEPPRAPA